MYVLKPYPVLGIKKPNLGAVIMSLLYSHMTKVFARHTQILVPCRAKKNYSSLISYPIMLKQHRSCSFIFKENFCIIKISKIPHLNKETAYSYSCSASALQQIIKNYKDRGYTDCLPHSIMIPGIQNEV